MRGFTDVVGEIALGSSGRRAPVVAGTMDAWSGLAGAGVATAGQGVYMSGTSEIVAIASAERIGAPGVVTFPPAAGLTINAGPTQSGGDALQWWAGRCGRDIEGALAEAEKADRDGPADPVPAAARRRARAAVGRGLARRLRRPRPPDGRAGVGARRARGRRPVGALAVCGLRRRCGRRDGAAVSRRRRRALRSLGADPRRLSGIPLDRVACLDVGCLGAAMMAAVGVGAYPTLAEAVSRMSRVERVFAPNPRRKARYDALFDAYQRATEALRPIGIIG